ncbi:MAG: hypothetical protein ACTS3F_07750 [Phycisphaerales bacterium]
MLSSTNGNKAGDDGGVGCASGAGGSVMEAAAAACGIAGCSLGWDAHAGSSLSAADLMIALIADRLERMVDRMMLAGDARLGLLGRVDHLKWLFAHVHGMRQMPVTAYIAPPGMAIDGWTDPALAAAFPIRRPAGVPDAAWYDLGDPTLPDAIDAVLVCDDLYQQACVSAARGVLPPRVTIARLYDRLPIGQMTPASGGTPGAPSGVVVRRTSVGAGRDVHELAG